MSRIHARASHARTHASKQASMHARKQASKQARLPRRAEEKRRLSDGEDELLKERLDFDMFQKQARNHQRTHPLYPVYAECRLALLSGLSPTIFTVRPRCPSHSRTIPTLIASILPLLSVRVSLHLDVPALIVSFPIAVLCFPHLGVLSEGVLRWTTLAWSNFIRRVATAGDSVHAQAPEGAARSYAA